MPETTWLATVLSSDYQEKGTSKEARGPKANLRNLENFIK